MANIKKLLQKAATHLRSTSGVDKYPLAIELDAAAESLGEPVAWLCTTGCGTLTDAVVTEAGKGIYEQCGRTIQPLYLAPQPAVPDAHQLWAAAQLGHGEGITDGIARIEALLAAGDK